MTRKPTPRLLIIDDDPAVLQLMHRLLGAGREVLLARCAADVEGYFGEAPPHVVMLDWKLPDGDGMDLLPRLKARWPNAQVIIMSGYSSEDLIVEAIKRGAYHFKSKPFVGSDLQRLVEDAFAVWREDYGGEDNPVAHSLKMRDVLRLASRVAVNDISVLITGESGTGKEILGKLLHSRSQRASGPLVTINCAALPRELIESELFGALKGAYTGAVTSRHGLLREAEGGTLFLDEISEMPVATQAKLLRVLQQKEFRPVGGTANVKANCRIIAATNREPAKAIADGHLRADLFYRIGAITIHIPPLRERQEDILPLAQRFLERLATKGGRRIQGFTKEVQQIFERYPWPGNVRQLENEIQRAELMCERNVIGVDDLSPELQPQPVTSAPPTSPLEEAEREVIVATLRECRGSKRAAAKKLGIARATLQSKLKQYGLQNLPDAEPQEPTRVFAGGVN